MFNSFHMNQNNFGAFVLSKVIENLMVSDIALVAKPSHFAESEFLA